MSKRIEVISSISSNGYRPPRTNDRCVVCGSGNMIDSPEGLTCGENICRDHLLDEFFCIVEQKNKERQDRMEEIFSTGLEKIDNIITKMEDIEEALPRILGDNIQILESIRKELKQSLLFL